MASYNTKTFTVGDVTLTASKAKSTSAADRLEAVLKWIGEQLAKPDQGLPGSQPGVDNTLPRPPSGGRPDNTLPGSQPGVDNTLPGQPAKPDNTLPGAQPGVDNSLPGFISNNAKEIAAAILKGTACDPAQPK